MLFTAQKIPPALDLLTVVPKSANIGEEQPRVRIFVNSRGLHGNVPYSPESQILTLALKSLSINYDVQQINGRTIAGKELPVLQVGSNLFERPQFVDVVAELLLLPGEELQVQLQAQHLLSLLRKLQLCTHYFMYFDEGTIFRQRNPYWFFITPVLKTQFYLKMKAYHHLLEEQDGLESTQQALARAQELLIQIATLQKELKSKIPEEKQTFSDLILSCYIQEALKNIPESQISILIKKNFNQLILQQSPLRTEPQPGLRFYALQKPQVQIVSQELEPFRKQFLLALPLLVTFTLIYKSLRV